MVEINGDDNNNTLIGTSGSDTIRGEGGNDSINGGSGNDTVYGGDGDDSITGGAGDDVIVGGRGNDTMAAGSGSPSDTFVIRDGDGSDTITDFDPGEPDIVDFRMAEITSFDDVLDRMSMVGNDTIITYDNGDTLRLLNVNSSNLTSTNFTYSTGPVCLHAGTIVTTPTGAVAIEDIAAGDLVWTLDHGPQPVRQTIQQRVHFSRQSDAGKPVLIKAGSLGDNIPARDTIVSPQHRIVVMRQNGGDGLIAARKLIQRQGVRQMRGRMQAHYINLLFDRHEVIVANGMLAESLLVTEHAQRAAPKLCRMPQVRPLQAMTPARPILQVDPAARHIGYAGARRVA